MEDLDTPLKDEKVKHKKEHEDYDDIEESEEQEETDIKKDKTFKKIYFADFETMTKNESKDSIQHEPFLICHNNYDLK